MATIKSFSDLRQSKKLAEILSIESADMFYTSLNRDYPWIWIDKHLMEVEDIPCWSLAALLGVLPKNLKIGRPSLESNYKGYYWIQYYDEFMKPNDYKTECFDNPVDACYELILKLHELKML